MSSATRSNCKRVPRVGIVLASIVMAIAPSVAQDRESAAAIDVEMRRLRRSDVTDLERAAACAAILEFGADGARILLPHATAELAHQLALLRRDGDRYTRDLAIAARALLQRRLRGLDAKIETLRKDALAVTRSADLTDARIHAEIDPKVAQLREWLRITAESVLDAKPALRASRARVDAHLVAAGEWQAVVDACTASLRTTSNTDGRPSERRATVDAEAARLEFLAAERDATFAAMPMSARDARVLLANRAIERTIDVREAEGIRELNEIRALLGLAVLAIDVRLCNASRDHSNDMRERGFFSHTSPIPGKESFGRRAALAGTSASAENIAVGHGTGRSAIRGWWYSPGHHKNMLGDHARVGLGRSESHWTQMFGG